MFERVRPALTWRGHNHAHIMPEPDPETCYQRVLAGQSPLLTVTDYPSLTPVPTLSAALIPHHHSHPCGSACLPRRNQSRLRSRNTPGFLSSPARAQRIILHDLPLDRPLRGTHPPLLLEHGAPLRHTLNAYFQPHSPRESPAVSRFSGL